jgi:tetratricopeptide (TPR) repeat protein
LWLGQAVADEGDFRRAQRLFDESSRRFREIGDEHYALLARRLFAWMLNALGKRQLARDAHEENLRQARAAGNEGLEATTLGALASYAAEEGRIADACSLAPQSLRIYRDLGSRRGVAQQLCRCAAALAIGGRAETAAQLLACSEALHDEMGASILPYLAAENENTLAVIRSQVDAETFAKARERGLRMSADEAVALALRSLEETPSWT